MTRSVTRVDFTPTYFISDAFNLYVGRACRLDAGLAGVAAATI